MFRFCEENATFATERLQVSPPPLEIVQLELLLDGADVLATGFEGAVMDAVVKIGGELLLNQRLEDDPEHQRGAAIALGREEHQSIALVFLDRDGHHISIEDAELSRHPIADALLGRR
jgi:hypothetical protein